MCSVNLLTNEYEFVRFNRPVLRNSSFGASATECVFDITIFGDGDLDSPHSEMDFDYQATLGH